MIFDICIKVDTTIKSRDKEIYIKKEKKEKLVGNKREETIKMP